MNGLTGTRIFLVAAPAFFLGMVAGGAVMYQRSSLLASSEDWTLTFEAAAANCEAPSQTTISITRVASIVRTVKPRGAGGKGFVEQGRHLRADIAHPAKPLVTVQGSLGAVSAENTWEQAEGSGAGKCRGTWVGKLAAPS